MRFLVQYEENAVQTIRNERYLGGPEQPRKLQAAERRQEARENEKGGVETELDVDHGGSAVGLSIVDLWIMTDVHQFFFDFGLCLSCS